VKRKNGIANGRGRQQDGKEVMEEAETKAAGTERWRGCVQQAAVRSAVNTAHCSRRSSTTERQGSARRCSSAAAVPGGLKTHLTLAIFLIYICPPTPPPQYLDRLHIRVHLWWVSRWIRRLLVVTGARCPLTKPVVAAVEQQATTEPHCSRGVQPGGIYAYVVHREPTPGGPGSGLCRRGRKRFLCQLPL
jgi:hypothetical protein